MNLQFKTQGVGPKLYLVATYLQPFLESPIPKILWPRHAPHNIERGIPYSEFYQTAAAYEQDDSLSKRSAVLAQAGETFVHLVLIILLLMFLHIMHLNA
jgi:hypothetical protein